MPENRTIRRLVFSRRKDMEEKIAFAYTLAELGLGVTASSIMTDCEKYGMSYG